MDNNKKEDLTFYGLGIAPGMLEILRKLSYVKPTPIQHQSIAVAIEGKDIVGVAQTGTGKTLAFGIPMIQRLAQTKGMGLVLSPTRELAMQTDLQLHRLGNTIGLKTAVLIGGVPIRPQISDLRRNPDIIVATPGRLIDHLHQRTASLSKVNILVLDEADRMLDMGFLPQIKEILKVVPKERQTMLFSATLSSDVMKIASAEMKLPVRIEIAPAGTTVETVSQDIFIVSKEEKIILLEKILSRHAGSALVFARTRYGAHKVAKAISQMGYQAAEMHSDRTFGQRKMALDGFKSGKYKVLVATDIMARGIDVAGIEVVINYDLPSQAEDYVHRIGRTARAGNKGIAISFVMPSEQAELRAIEWLIKKKLNVSTIPGLGRQFAKPRMVYHSRRRR
ncbi:MAG: DEAD/DEAH box helicase [Candidatus Paceibacterota bacterium]|jgi:ATP-dependent RNA helicase RhlE